jgi:hypothetical protein
MINANSFLSIWHDIDMKGQAEYIEWHTLEHLPERASIPGFIRGRRGVAVNPHQSPKYVTFYEAAEPEVFRSQPYLERLDNPTPWTQQIQPTFQNFVRFANEVVAQRGFGDGAFLTTARFETVGASSVGFTDIHQLLTTLVDTIEALPHVATVALARSRDDITDYVTEETELRPVNPDLDGVSHIAVISVETVTEAGAGAVRSHIMQLQGELGDGRIGHCSTFLVDCVVNQHQVDGTAFSDSALDARGRK